MRCFLIGFVLLVLPPQASAERVRKVTMKRDQIAQVRTAIGVATIIQVPDAPTSLVVGDSEAFKVEFLEQAITIKPLGRSAKSNLYIYTEYRRFDVQLVTVGEPSADYVVYLLNEPVKAKPPSAQSWKQVNFNVSSDSINLRIKRTSQTPKSAFLEFEITGAKSVDVDPSWIWLTQGETTVSIHRLILSSFRLSKDGAIQGVLEVLKADANASAPIALEIRRKRKAGVQIPKVSTW